MDNIAKILGKVRPGICWLITTDEIGINKIQNLMNPLYIFIKYFIFFQYSFQVLMMFEPLIYVKIDTYLHIPLPYSIKI